MQGITREQLVELVKATGREVEHRAEDLVGDTEGMQDMDIWLRLSRIDVRQLYAMAQMILEEMDEEERNKVISKMMVVEEDLQ